MKWLKFAAMLFAVNSVCLRLLLVFLRDIGVITFQTAVSVVAGLDLLTLCGVGLLAWKKKDVPRAVYVLIAVPLVIDAMVAASLLRYRFADNVQNPAAVREAEALTAAISITSYKEELIRAPGIDHPVGLRMTIGLTPRGVDLWDYGFGCPILYHAPANGLYQAPDISSLARRSPKTHDMKDWEEGSDHVDTGYLPAFNGTGADIPALHTASLGNSGDSFKRGYVGEQAITCEVFSPGLRFYAAAPLKICARREAQRHKTVGDELVVRWPLRNGEDYADAGDLLMATLRDKHSVLLDPAQWAALMHDMSVPELVKDGLSRRCVDYNYASRTDDCYCPAEVVLPK